MMPAGLPLGLLFDAGLPEIALVLVVALILFGPRRLPDLARRLGRATTELRRMSRLFTDELTRADGEEHSDHGAEPTGPVQDSDPREGTKPQDDSHGLAG